MAGSPCVFGANETEPVTLTKGNHEVAFTGPTAATGTVTRRVELGVKDNTRAQSEIPGNTISGWAHENNSENKSIDIDKCDDSPGNDDLTIGYHGSPIGDSAYNFVTTIVGTITTCGESGVEGGSDSNEFTLEIKQKDTIAIKPNPANVRVSTNENPHWIKLTAVLYEGGETENTETEVIVDWAHVEDVEFSASEGGAILSESQVNDLEDTFIWAKSSVARKYTVQATLLGEGGGEIEGTLNVVNADLGAMKVSHNAANGELPATDKITPGAFVPINNDDDDYDENNTADKDQPGIVSGENDLLPIKLHVVDPVVSGSKYTLDIPDHLKIWKENEDGWEEITETSEISADEETMLFVEGISVGTDNIKLNWKHGSATLDDCDEIKVTVFNWVGPLNVPAYAIYQYKANGALETSKWNTPDSGTIKTGANSSDVTILWEEGPEGPVVGKAIYQVNDNYIWDLEVNVVQVKIKQGESNEVSYSNNIFQLPYTDDLKRKIWTGAGAQKGMTAELSVEKVKGPEVNGENRGVKFIEMGIIKNVRITRVWGNFDGFTPKRKRQSDMVGDKVYLDGDPLGTIPWFDPRGELADDVKSFHAQSDSDETIHEDVNFKIVDTPAVIATDKMEITINGVTEKVNSFEIEINFDVYFAVRTTDDKNNSDLIYIQRAHFPWTFNGSGSVDATGVWTASAEAKTGDAEKFSETKIGEEVPVSDDPWAINVLNNSGWSTVEQ